MIENKPFPDPVEKPPLSQLRCLFYGGFLPLVLVLGGVVAALMYLLKSGSSSSSTPGGFNIDFGGILILAAVSFIGTFVYLPFIVIYSILAGCRRSKTRLRAFLSGLLGIGIGIFSATIVVVAVCAILVWAS